MLMLCYAGAVKGRRLQRCTRAMKDYQKAKSELKHLLLEQTTTF